MLLVLQEIIALRQQNHALCDVQFIYGSQLLIILWKGEIPKTHLRWGLPIKYI